MPFDLHMIRGGTIMKRKDKMHKLLLFATFLWVTGCMFCIKSKPVLAADTMMISKGQQCLDYEDEYGDAIVGENQEYALPAAGYEEKEKTTTTSSVSNKDKVVKRGSSSLNRFGENAGNGGTYGNIHWDISETTLTISGTGAIPDSSDESPAPWQSLQVTNIVIGEGISAIGKRNFSEMTSVTMVEFPSSLNTIGEAAFYGCSKLTQAIVPAGVTTIESGAFADCTAMTTFSAVGATTMGDYALQRTQLTTFEVPKGLTQFSGMILFGCNVIEQLTVAQGNTTFMVKDDVLYSIDQSTLVLYPCNKKDVSFTIPAGVTKVADYAFSRTNNLTSIDFSNVTSLGDGAFYQSSLSGALVLSDKITEAGYFTFENSVNITSVKFGSGIVETPYRMFENCAGIVSIDFGGLKKLGMRAFRSCTSIKEVTLPDTMTEWGGSVFNACTSLETFTARGLKEVTYADFCDCTNLKNVNLTSVEKIYREAFTYCESLKEITLPACIQWVDANAFEEGVNVVCLNKELTKFGRNGLHYEETITISGVRDYKKALEVLAIVNQVRGQNGLPALTMDEGLLETAMIRAGEQAVLFSHTRPDSTICFKANPDMMAENIAIGQQTATGVMDSWMNSEGHKENILMTNAKCIGIGCFEIGGRYTWVQCFGEKESSSFVPAASVRPVNQEIHLQRDTFGEAATGPGIIFNFGGSQEYTYKVEVVTAKADDEDIEENQCIIGKNMQVKLRLINPGYSSMRVDFSSNNISWTSDNPAVATVDGSGKVSFLKAGNATITGKTKYMEAKWEITVKGGKQAINNQIKEVLQVKGDKDLASSSYSKLRLRSGKVSKDSIQLTWAKVKGAATYGIMGSKCGTKYKEIERLSKTSYTVKKISGSKIKKGTYYKFVVIAFDKNGEQLVVSKTIYVATAGGKVGNCKSVKLNKKKISLKKNKKVKIKATVVAKSKKLKIKKYRGIAFESSNPNIASVNGKGEIKAKKKGKCTIYVYAQNGISNKVTVHVK